ncbi:MAG: S8 family serine peptidase [Hyphomonadaceae bacterium]|nr:MAG: serine protease [Caulobacteraceae bacterium]MBT9444242.1 S8 family serine peptidase [Hyphomonadaceae bacterium]
MTGKFRAARFALALAPIIALMSCDQIGRVLENVGAPEVSGPATLASVSADARSMGGATVAPEAEMQALLAPEPVMFVPGEILVGAKIDDELAQAASELGMRMMSRFAPDGTPQALDSRLEAKAIENAVEEATRDARTVLSRLHVNGEIEVSPSGMVKIDLTPENTASPTGFTRFAQAEAAAAPPPGAEEPDAGAPSEPDAVVDTGQRCPRNVSTAQMEADLTLKTICALERLQASRQFQFVEKNYVIGIEFERLPIFGKKPQPTAPAPAPGAPKTTPAAPNAELAATGALPNDPLLGFQWDMRARGTAAGQSPGGAGFEPFWTNARQVGRRAVRVAVIDTGVELAHPDMRASANLVQGIDLIVDYDRAGDGNGVDRDANDVGDACGAGRENSFHGTHVAGTVGAAVTNDRRGVAGGAWNVTVIPVRAIGRCGGELEDIVNAIRWSAGLAPAVTETGEQILNTTPADIINMSLSVQIACPASMQAAIDAAVAKGAVIVVAAGNKSNAVANYAPANCNNVVVVAANDARGNIAFYSNFGPGVDVLAPGGDVFADSDGDGRPDGVLSTRTTANDCYDPETRQPAATCYYGFLQGTSMAAPHVAAALALLQSQYNVRGKALEDLLLTRALGPIDADAQCSVDCARNANATPIAGRPGKCMRQCGRGMLDLARAAPEPASPAAAPGGP